MLSVLLASLAAVCPAYEPSTATPALALGSDSCLSFGAFMYERYEFIGNPDWGAQMTDTNGYLLHRLLAHAELAWSDNLRAWVELGAAGVYGAKDRERPTDRDWFDLHQGYVELPLGILPLTLRGGRQEVNFGSSRLVSVREGTNVRRRFDGVRATLRTGPVRTDAIVLRPVETDKGVFDDQPERGQWLWGAYGTAVLSSTLSFDLYYLGLRRPDAEFGQGIGEELRHSIGTRVFGAAFGFDYDLELLYQLGSFGETRLNAWMIASDAGFTADEWVTRPRIGLSASVTSGDRDPHDRGLETFNPLFPKGDYFSEAGLIGPLNHIDVHPSLELRLSKELVATLGGGFFWRASSNDAVYRISTVPVVSGDRSRARYVGSQAAVELDWEIDAQLTFVATYVHFFAGEFLSEAGSGRDVDFVATWLAVRL